MAVRSDRLGRLDIFGTIVTTMFTVPAGETWLVKRVCSFAHTGAATLWWEELDPTALRAVMHRVVFPGNAQTDDHETWWALDAGSKLVINHIGAAARSYVVAYGAKLSGVA